MPVCEMCKKKQKKVFKCKECGSAYCEKCGNKDRELCEDCEAYEEATQGSYKLEQEIEVGSDSDSD